MMRYGEHEAAMLKVRVWWRGGRAPSGLEDLQACVVVPAGGNSSLPATASPPTSRTHARAQLCDILLALSAARVCHRTLLAFRSATAKPWVRAVEVSAMRVSKTCLGFVLAGIGQAIDMELVTA